jgi:hypothetical protein
MTTEYIVLLDAVLVSRLVFVGSDAPLRAKKLVMLMLIQCLGLVPLQPGVAWGMLFAYLPVHALLFHAVEKRGTKPEGVRFVSLVVQAVVLSFFFSPAAGIRFNAGMMEWVKGLGQFSFLASELASARGAVWSAVLCGGLIVLNEANLLIRYQLVLLKLAPGAGDAGKNTVDGAEYSAGRVIGFLERVLIYGAVLSAQIAAIGLILAAKGFTRFKEMDDRNFSEYVLIGTMMSALFAILVGLAVKSYLGW